MNIIKCRRHNNETITSIQSGFTLIELSIVLVIIGLIVGGILAGQELIRSAELHSIVSQKAQYSIAMNAFRNKYGCLPGDCATATQLFGVLRGNTSDNYTSSCYGNNGGTNGTDTCNGDGDGHICSAFGIYYTAVTCNEGILAWQHLASAGMIEGNYSPYEQAGVSTNPYEVVGGNIPAAKAKAKTGYSISFICMNNGYFFDNGHCAHTFIYGAQDPVNDDNYIGEAAFPALSAMDAYRIDKKIDDGSPARGTVTTFTNNGYFQNACSTTDGPTITASTQYPISVTNAPTCALMFTADGF
ncbi:MAG TPA: prepilin-type N-terminal cleavage/methylation domain-containing protein [Rickettsiales bacterium]|nr:prepilin-type N-terminal cleavage/methylation domain-containing protein [Rickettsiales bacterium]